jgi:hypothetical protein
MNMSDFHYNHILKKDVWHELEIKALLNADSSIIDLLRAAIVANILTPVCTVTIADDGASVYGFKATEIIQWAKLKGFEIPQLNRGNQDQAVDVCTSKAVKKLIPLKRETNEALLLLYEMFKFYDVKYSDDLGATTAWGRIINKEFTSDLIKEVNQKHIVLNGGGRLDKSDFCDKWRRRFK